jgi:hypothetical protein
VGDSKWEESGVVVCLHIRDLVGRDLRSFVGDDLLLAWDVMFGTLTKRKIRSEGRFFVAASCSLVLLRI